MLDEDDRNALKDFSQFVLDTDEFLDPCRIMGLDE